MNSIAQVGDATGSAELRLVHFSEHSVGKTSCLLCSESFELTAADAVFFDGPRPLGHLCCKCIATGPRAAAAMLRRHVADIDALVDKARSGLSGELWASIVQPLRERSSRWQSLTDRLDKLEKWIVQEKN